MKRGDVIQFALSICMLAILSLSAHSQFYLSFRTGYNQDSFGPKLGERGRIADTTIFEENIYGTLAQGWNFNLEVGYFFTDHICVQLDLGYLHGFTKDIVDYKGTAFGVAAEQFIQARTRQFRASPQFVFRTANRIYGRFGFTVPVYGVTKSYTRTSGPVAPGVGVTEEREVSSHGQFAIGALAAVGYELMLSQKASLIFDVEYVGLTVKRQRFEVTSYTVNGVDLLSTLPDSQKDADYPEQERSASPYSSININVGFRWRFGE